MTASQFVLVYDTTAGTLTELKQFRDARAASDAVIELERRYADVTNVHVVMLGGESLESLKATHGTYFRDVSDLLDALAAAAA
jgi:hypothetical protein